MRQHIILVCFVIGIASLKAQRHNIIYEESKVPDFTLPSLLISEKGHEISSIKEWEEIRRPELIHIFAKEMFGITPQGNIDISYKELYSNKKALNGKVTCKQIKVIFTNGIIQREMLLLIYLPNQVSGKVPVFLSYNFNGNQTISSEIEIIPSNNADRANQKSRWPIDMILSAGYGLATIWYGDIFPDEKNKHAESILPLFGYRSSHNINGDSWQAIGAWAWGLSRAMDYFITDDDIDDSKVIVMGHSRQGKAALWAGAQDKRFAIVVANDSGCGGAALSKRTFGETIDIITASFPHWFCYNFNYYANDEQALTFDQHQLLALIAPRPLYVSSAEDDKWSDPKGEFLSAMYAGEVYKLYEMTGLDTDAMPEINKPVMNRIGYHIRSGKHDVTDFDWKSFIAFADKWLK